MWPMQSLNLTMGDSLCLIESELILSKLCHSDHRTSSLSLFHFLAAWRSSRAHCLLLQFSKGIVLYNLSPLHKRGCLALYVVCKAYD